MLRSTLGRRTRYLHLWLPGYLRTWYRRRGDAPAKRVWFTIADHFEPRWKGADPGLARARVDAWRRAWPEIAARFADSKGRPPRYTFFYPEEEYGPELIEPLAEMTTAGIADVEIHLHHDGEGEQNFIDRMGGFIDVLSRRHGLLRKEHGRVVFGFIHGNWALDNARPDGRYCGLNNEISLLRDLGCYADFTLPAAPDPCQAGPVNVIFTATDDPSRPRSHAAGREARVGAPNPGDLLFIPGPLGIGSWPLGPVRRPRLEAGELAGHYPPTRERVRRWLSIAPRIGPDVFVKLHTHGAQERNSHRLLGGDLDRLFQLLQREAAELGIEVHYVSAWGLYRAVRAALEGEVPTSEAARRER